MVMRNNMGIPLNPQKIPVKYELKIHRKTKKWPDEEGILYEIARYLEHQDGDVISRKKILDMLSDDEEKLEMITSKLCKKQFLKRMDDENFQMLKHGWE